VATVSAYSRMGDAIEHGAATCASRRGLPRPSGRTKHSTAKGIASKYMIKTRTGPPRQPAQVLVLEDDAHFRSVLVECLAGEGGFGYRLAWEPGTATAGRSDPPGRDSTSLASSRGGSALRCVRAGSW
jgi:hypothetical protein